MPWLRPNQDVIDAVHAVGQQVHGVSQQIVALQSPDFLQAVQALTQQITALIQEIKIMSDTLDAEITALTNNVAQLTTGRSERSRAAEWPVYSVGSRHCSGSGGRRDRRSAPAAQQPECLSGRADWRPRGGGDGQHASGARDSLT